MKSVFRKIALSGFACLSLMTANAALAQGSNYFDLSIVNRYAWNQIYLSIKPLFTFVTSVEFIGTYNNLGTSFDAANASYSLELDDNRFWVVTGADLGWHGCGTFSTSGHFSNSFNEGIAGQRYWETVNAAYAGSTNAFFRVYFEIEKPDPNGGLPRSP